MTEHNTITGTELHEAFHYVSASDPGAVGANLYWLDTSTTPYAIKRRNGTNSAWVSVGVGSSYTDEQAQDAVGAMADANTLTYTDSTPLLEVKKQMSITADGSGLKLSGDSTSPGNNKVYGTDGSGVKGWKSDPAASAAIYDRRWVRGSAANANDDEFNDGSLTGWTAVDNAGHSGYVTWVEGGDVLSGLVGNSADAAAELHAQMKRISFSVGDYIQTCIRGMGANSNYPHCSLLMADGVTYGAGNQAVFHTFWSTGAEAQGIGINPSTWTGYNTRASTTDYQPRFLGYSPIMHLRIKYSAANHFQFYYSPDAIQWIMIEDRAITMTPTYGGIAIGGWGTTTPFLFSIDYFRVNP